MWFALVSESRDPDITFEVLGQIAAAIETQLFRDYAPFCQSAGARCFAYDKLADVPSDATLIVIFDTPDAPDALGYHDLAPGGRPYAKIFWGPIKDAGGTLLTGPLSLSSVISHEALEALEDPYINAWWDGPDGTEYARELADPVEGDSYEIDGVSVSNFIGPRWSDPGGAGPYDFLGRLAAPFTMSPGGYMILRKDGNVSQVFGEKHVHLVRARRDRRLAA